MYAPLGQFSSFIYSDRIPRAYPNVFSSHTNWWRSHERMNEFKSNWKQNKKLNQAEKKLNKMKSMIQSFIPLAGINIPRKE